VCVCGCVRVCVCVSVCVRVCVHVRVSLDPKRMLRKKASDEWGPTWHGIPPCTVPERVRSPACAGGGKAALAAVVFFPGGAADEDAARRSRSHRKSGSVSTNRGTLSTRKATVSTERGPHLGLHPGYSEYPH
jgi:hypothetical protein